MFSVKKNIFILCFAVLLASCSSSVKLNITNKEEPLSIHDKVAVLDVKHQVPDDVVAIGTSKFGDTGFSISCDFNSNLIKAKKIARENGANIVKVTKSKDPNIWSSCYIMDIAFYKYDGEVDHLNQYKLQIN